MIPIEHYYIIASFLFIIGLAIILTKRNLIAILMGVELMLNAANINFVAFSQYDEQNSGQVFSVFVIVIAAAEAAVALAIISRVVKHFKTTDVDQLDSLKG